MAKKKIDPVIGNFDENAIVRSDQFRAKVGIEPGKVNPKKIPKIKFPPRNPDKMAQASPTVKSKIRPEPKEPSEKIPFALLAFYISLFFIFIVNNVAAVRVVKFTGMLDQSAALSYGILATIVIPALVACPVFLFRSLRRFTPFITVFFIATGVILAIHLYKLYSVGALNGLNIPLQ